jgi:hypothetical protein
VRASALFDKGFVAVSTVNLETRVPDVYAVGDVTRLPAGENFVPKAGAFAEDAARTVVSDIALKEGRAAERLKFRAQGACLLRDRRRAGRQDRRRLLRRREAEDVRRGTVGGAAPRQGGFRGIAPRPLVQELTSLAKPATRRASRG